MKNISYGRGSDRLQLREAREKRLRGHRAEVLERTAGMSLNNGLFTSNNDCWATPPEFFEELNREFNFDTDVCALPENTKCPHYYSPEDDGLRQNWTGTCWCNPPYGRQIRKWVEKAYMSSLLGTTVVMLLPARTDTAWFHDFIYGKAEIRFVRGRITFIGAKNGAPFPSMVVVFRGADSRKTSPDGASHKVRPILHPTD